MSRNPLMVIAIFTNSEEGLPPIQSDEILRYYDERKYVVRELTVGGRLWQDDHVSELEKIVSRRGGIENGGYYKSICLERLTLSNNGLTAQSGAKLAGILEAVHTLRELDLSDNMVLGDGLKRLAHALEADQCALKSLNLFNNHLGSKKCAQNIAYILRQNRSIVSLNLGKNRLKSKDCLEKLSKALCCNRYLQRLGLAHNKFGDHRARELAVVLDPRKSSCPLEELDLSGNSLTGSGVEEILGACLEGNNTTLRILNLSTNNLGLEGLDACAKFLQRSHTIQELLLSSCRVGDEGVALLCGGLTWTEEFGGSSLRRLDLGWNCIHDQGAVDLANVLEADPTMEFINLSSNGIGCTGAQALCQALRSNGTLRELDLSGNQILDFGAYRMAEFVCHDNFSLETLKWENNIRMTDSGRARLEAAFRFRQAKKGWLADILRKIETRRHMPSLDLKSKALGDEEMICLCRHLDLHRPFLPLLAIKSREGPGAITCRAVEILAKTTLSQNSIPVKRLYLQNTSMGDLGAAAIAQGLVYNRYLTVLSLTGCCITNEGAKFISNMLRRNHILERLDLRKNRIGDRGAQDLLASICDQAHPTLTSLNLSENLLTDLSLLGLLTLEPLKEIYLGNNSITDRGALDLARLCLNSSSIERLHVPGNCMTQQRGIQAILLYLPDHISVFESGNQRSCDANDEQSSLAED